MYSKLRKILLFGLLTMALGAAAASAASALTVTVAPGGAFTATGGWLTFRVGTVSITCQRSAMTGTFSTTSTTGAIAPAVALASPLDSTLGNITLTMSTCTVAGVPLTVTCSGRSNLVAISATASGITLMRLTGIACTFRLASGCTVSLASASSSTAPGGVAGRWTNSPSRYTIDAPTGTNQNLAFWNSTCTSVIPNGTVTMSGSQPVGGPANFTPTPSTTVTAV